MWVWIEIELKSKDFDQLLDFIAVHCPIPMWLIQANTQGNVSYSEQHYHPSTGDKNFLEILGLASHVSAKKCVYSITNIAKKLQHIVTR